MKSQCRGQSVIAKGLSVTEDKVWILLDCDWECYQRKRGAS